MAIEPVASLFSYFRTEVDRARQRRNVAAAAETTDHLANVLVTFASGQHAALLHRSIVLTLDDALSRSPGEQLLELQSVGDGALYLVSFFPDALARAELDAGLYVHVGAFAYGRAADIARAHGTREPRVLDELEAKFGTFVDVLGEVAASSALGTLTRDLVKLFDQWKSTGSARALEAMARSGAFPTKGGGHAC